MIGAISEAVFWGVGVLSMAMAIFAMLRMGYMRLDSRIGIVKDGVAPGEKTPHWRLEDVNGRLLTSPAHDGDRWQLVVCVDRSLGGFPGLVNQMREFSTNTPDLEVIVLARESPEICAAIVRGLQLDVPIISVTQQVYDSYKVRVLPFLFLLDAHGIVVWKGLFMTGEQLAHTWRTAHALTHV
jgi:hypothetical protein